MRNLLGMAVLSAAGMFFSVTSHAEATRCPDTGHYYDYVTTFCGQPWVDAQAQAEALGGYLATITSDEEQVCLGDIPAGLGGFWWLGGSDQAVEGQWRWVNGPEQGELFSYTNWGSGEPNNAGNEDYLIFYAGAGFGGLNKWLDAGWSNRYVCGYAIEYDTNPNGVLEVPMDIKFCNDENSFNCRSRGKLPVLVFGTDDLDVMDIDPLSLRLCLADGETCTGAPHDTSLADLGDPATDIGTGSCAVVEVQPGVFEQQDYLNPDLRLDLEAEFEVQELVALLGGFCELGKGANSESLIVKGETWAGEPFESVPVGDPAVDQLTKVNKHGSSNGRGKKK